MMIDLNNFYVVPRLKIFFFVCDVLNKTKTIAVLWVS